jgi:hypothetical protein
MFGRRTDTRRTRSGGVFGGSNLRRAAIAGVGMLAMQWWRNRQAANRASRSDQPRVRDDMIQPS